MSKEFWQKSKWLLDAINIDLKWFSEEFYRSICWGMLEPILKNIKYIYNETDIWLEITTLIIPWENDSDEEISKMAKFIKSVSPDIPWHISSFHPDYKMRNHKSTPIETLKKAYNIWKQAWIKYIYLWNVLDPEHETTFCPKCKEKLIERRWYIWDQLNIKWETPWICQNCWKKIPWVWK